MTDVLCAGCGRPIPVDPRHCYLGKALYYHPGCTPKGMVVWPPEGERPR